MYKMLITSYANYAQSKDDKKLPSTVWLLICVVVLQTSRLSFYFYFVFIKYCFRNESFIKENVALF